jgi:hypothetical protein
MWACLAQHGSQFVASYIVGSSGDPMRLVDDDQIPTAADNRFDAIFVVLFDLFALNSSRENPAA